MCHHVLPFAPVSAVTLFLQYSYRAFFEASFCGCCAVWSTARPSVQTRRLAGNARWHIRAASIRLATGNSDTRPSPARARTRATCNHNIVARTRDSATSRNALDGKTRDRNTRARCSSIKVTAVVVLFNENSISVGRVSNKFGLRLSHSFLFFQHTQKSQRE